MVSAAATAEMVVLTAATPGVAGGAAASGLNEPLSTMTLVSVQSIDGLLHILLVLHLHERKVVLQHNVHDVAVFDELVANVAVPRARREVADIDFVVEPAAGSVPCLFCHDQED